MVTDFSANDWNGTGGKWCDAHGLDGGLFSFAGTTPSMAAATVDTTVAARNFKLNLMVSAGQYAGAGLSFDSCVNASAAPAFNAVQFTAAITSGSLTNCAWQVQVQTQDQRPSTSTSPGGGTCASNCNRFPAYVIAAAPPPTPMTFIAPFSGFTNPSGSTIPMAQQVVGLQWQVNSSGGTGTCTVELRIDDIKFITQ
jgi:hypothetical protein